MRLPLSVTVHRDRYSEADIESTVDSYDMLRRNAQPYGSQRYTEDFGSVEYYGWSEDKARQYARPERQDFGRFIRKKGFNLD